jgi:hypothetical protein
MRIDRITTTLPKTALAGAAALLLLGSPAAKPAAAQTATTPDRSASVETYVSVKRPVLAATEVVAVNAVVWIYDRYIRENGTNPGFRIGFNSWEENIKNGFEWDDNSFSTNQYAHPYHGNMYFNSARSNGFNYWESIPFAFAGSFMWEYFGEVHHPAMNDWIATSVGGTTLGETLYRLSVQVSDNTATGSERTWRELGATLLNPVRGFTRLVTGDFTRVHANPPDRYPSTLHAFYRVGLRTVGEENLWTADTSRVFMEFAMANGDPFQGDRKKPFESFQLGAQLNFGDKATLGRVQVVGLLTASQLLETENSTHLIGASQHFDYFNNNAFELGGQSVGGTLLSRMKAGKDFEMRTELNANVIVMGATKADYRSISGRDYDFGPGLGYKFGGVFLYRGHPFLVLSHNQSWIHSINGTAAEHVVSGTRARVDIPLTRGFSVGADYVIYFADRNYKDFPDVHERVPELRTGVSFNL